MLDNVSEYLKIESTSNTTRNILSLLQSTLKKAKYLIDLKPNELRILLFLGKWRYESLIDESNGMEGNTKSRKIMNATCWKQHYMSLENLLKKRGQLYSCPHLPESKKN